MSTSVPESVILGFLQRVPTSDAVRMNGQFPDVGAPGTLLSVRTRRPTSATTPSRCPPSLRNGASKRGPGPWTLTALVRNKVWGYGGQNGVIFELRASRLRWGGTRVEPCGTWNIMEHGVSSDLFPNLSHFRPDL